MGSDRAAIHRAEVAALAQRIEDEELRIAALRLAGQDTTHAVAELDRLKAKHRSMIAPDA